MEWIFPLDFVEVVTGDGERTTAWPGTVPATGLPPVGSHTFEVPFDEAGQPWVRFAAWDPVGNGAMTTPVRPE